MTGLSPFINFQHWLVGRGKRRGKASSEKANYAVKSLKDIVGRRVILASSCLVKEGREERKEGVLIWESKVTKDGWKTGGGENKTWKD